MYLKNLAVLEKRFPGFEKQLKQGIDRTGQEPEIELEIEEARSGEPTARMAGKYLHSRFDPRSEAGKIIRREVPDDCQALLFEGFGLGYLVEAFLEQEKAIPVIVIEPSARRFLKALETRSMENLLGNQALTLMVGADPSLTGPILSRLPRGTRLHTVRLRPLYESDPDSFAPYDQAMEQFYSREEVNDATLDRFAFTWTRNLVRNIEAMAEAGDVGALEGRFSGMAALLLAAGPTLDLVLDRFDEVQSKVLVIAVDTAMRALTLRGIKPDILVVVDPQYWNSRHLDSSDLSETVLVSESSTHPRIFRHKAGRLLYCGSLFPLGSYLEAATGPNRRVAAGGSVATSAFSLAAFMGVDALYLAGLDLGYPDGHTHFKGSFFEERGHSLSSRQAPFEQFTHRLIHEAGRRNIPSADGGTLVSDSRLAVYRTWFSDQLKLPVYPKVFTLSGRSAAIEGVNIALIEEILSLPDISDQKKQLLEAIPRRSSEEAEERKAVLASALQKLSQELELLAGTAESAAERSRQALRLLAAGQRDDGAGAELEKLDKQLGASSSREIASFLIQPFLRTFAQECEARHHESVHLESLKNSARLYDTIAGATRGILDLL
jgi:hypothetical protein